MSLNDLHKSPADSDDVNAVNTFHQVSNDLSHCRTRIDANIFEQRKYREVIASLNNKLLSYRRRAASTSVQLSNISSPAGDLTATGLLKSSPFPKNRSLDSCLKSDELLNKSLISLADDFEESKDVDLGFEYVADQLREEQIRNNELEEIAEMLRDQAELALFANQSLQEDLYKATAELKSLQERESDSHSSHRNEQKQHTHIEVDKKCLMQLWICSNQFRNQVKNLRREIERDLDRQKTEFFRCANNIEKVLCMAELKQFEQKSVTQDADSGGVDHYLKLYEKVAARNAKMEHKLFQSNRNLTQLKRKLDLTNDAREAAVDRLQKISRIPELCSSPLPKERSTSPAMITVFKDLPYRVRKALQERDHEIRLLKDRQQKISILQGEISRSIEYQKVAENSLADFKRKYERLKFEKDDCELRYKRLMENVERLDLERSETENAIMQLQDQISAITKAHGSIINELSEKHRLEVDRLHCYFKDELADVDAVSTKRQKNAETELEMTKRELENVKGSFKRVSDDLSSEKRRNEEKDAVIAVISVSEKSLRNQLELYIKKFEDKEIWALNLDRKCDDQTETLRSYESLVNKLEDDKTTAFDENHILYVEIASLKKEVVDAEQKFLHEHERWCEEIRLLNSKIAGNEEINFNLENQLSNIQLQIDSTKSKLQSARNEIGVQDLENVEMRSKISILIGDKAMVLREKESILKELLTGKNETSELHEHIALLEKNAKELSAKEYGQREIIKKLTISEWNTKNEMQKVYDDAIELQKQLDVSKKEKSDLMEEIEHTRERHEREMQKLTAKYDQQFKDFLKDKKVAEQKQSEVGIQLVDALCATDQLSSRCMELEALLEETDCATAENIELRRELKEMSALHDSFMEELESEKSMVERRRDELEKELENVIQSYNRKVLELETINGESKADILRCTDELSNRSKSLYQLQNDLEVEQNVIKEMKENYDREKQTFLARIQNDQAVIRDIRADYERGNSKCNEMARVLGEFERKSERMAERLANAEEELNKAGNQLSVCVQQRSERDNMLIIMESELMEIKAYRDALKIELHEKKLEISDAKDDIVAHKKELSMLKTKINDAMNINSKYEIEIDRLRAEKKESGAVLAAKSEDLKCLLIKISEYETRWNVTVGELKSEREKNLCNEEMLRCLKAQIQQLHSELTRVNSDCEKRISIENATLNTSIGNHRTSELVEEAFRANENLLSEIMAVNSRLERQTAKLEKADRKSKEIWASHNDLTQRVANYENTARKVLSAVEVRSLDDSSNFLVLNQLVDLPKRSLSSNIPPHDIELGLYNHDLSLVTVAFRYLKDRIKVLENEKNEFSFFRENLKSLEQKSLEEDEYHSKELIRLKKLNAEMEDEIRNLSMQLTSSRQLLISQEETLRAKERERKSLKARIISCELHARDKDAQIATLKGELVIVKEEVSSLKNERNYYEKNEAESIEERKYLESFLKNAEANVEMYSSDFATSNLANEKLTQRVKEIEEQYLIAQQKCVQAEKAIGKYRSVIEQLKLNEAASKSSIDTLEKVRLDSGTCEVKLMQLEHDFDELYATHQATEFEKNQLRNEIEKAKNELNSSKQKLHLMKQSYDEITFQLQRSRERLLILEKYECESHHIENESRHELEKLRAAKLTLSAETQALKKRLQKYDVERREFDVHKARVERENAALKSHIEMLEQDKRRTELAVREMKSVRLSLDKSLFAMENENKELHQNCFQLQSQINLLERESCSSGVQNVTRHVRLLEARAHQCDQERQHAEITLQKLEKAYKQRITSLEAKTTDLEEQLDSEKRRRRDFVREAAVYDRDIGEIRTVLDQSIASLQMTMLTPTKSGSGSRNVCHRECKRTRSIPSLR